MQTTTKLCVTLGLCYCLSACVGKVVGAAVDTTIEVAKVPFKVAGAAIDVATLNKKRKKSESNNKDDDEG